MSQAPTKYPSLRTVVCLSSLLVSNIVQMKHSPLCSFFKPFLNQILASISQPLKKCPTSSPSSTSPRVLCPMVQTKKVFYSMPCRKAASTDAEPEGCPQDLLSSDVMYFGRTLLCCVIEGSSPHTQAEGQAKEPKYPHQRQ